jgi:hypothetical protein
MMNAPPITFRNIIFLALFISPFVTSAQSSKQDSIWLPLKFFIGTWKGTGGGEPGIGDYERSYRFILNKKFIEVKNKSIYPPTEKYPQGETHEDIGYISYDQIRHSFVLRQFHVEGFVNQYILESISADGRRIVFISETIENIPKGWRAKETYELVKNNEFAETFALAPPDKEFEVYTKVTLQWTN